MKKTVMQWLKEDGRRQIAYTGSAAGLMVNVQDEHGASDVFTPKTDSLRAPDIQAAVDRMTGQ